MAVLRTKEELIAALENSVFSADPIADLVRKGYSLSLALKSEWEVARTGKTLPRLPLGVRPENFRGTLAFKADPPALPIPDVPPGSYDVVAGITLDAANEALAGVYQSGTIPHQIALDQLLSPSQLLGLASFFKVDRSGGQISSLHITSTPTVTSTTDGSSVVAVQIPIQIDWVHVTRIVGRTISHLVTEAIGTLQLTMKLVPQPNIPPEMAIAVQLVGAPSTPQESPRLTLDVNSPVQLAKPAPPDQIDQTALAIQLALALQFQNTLSWPLSPIFTLPIGTLEVRQLDVVANGGVLLAGVNVLGSGGMGDPSTLTNLLPDPASNLYLQVREIVPNLLLQQDLASGKLTAMAQQQHSNAVVDSASASFQNNAIVVQIHGRLVKECPFDLDLGFWASQTATIKFLGSSIEIDQKSDNGIDASKSVWCLVTTLGLAALALLAVGLLGGIADALGILGAFLLDVGVYELVSFLNASPDGNKPTIIDLTQPIPGSDMLPTLSGGNIQVTSGTLLIAATAGTKLDDINLEIYVRFLVQRANAVAIRDTVPLVGATVVLMDQDVPLPPDEEIPALPADTYQTIPSDPYSEVPGQLIATTYSLELPTSDQKLGEGSTDLDGVVRFALLRDQFPTAGTIVATITSSYDDDSIPPTTSTQATPVTDPTPDVYFLVTMPDKSVVDSRNFAGGFLPNVSTSQIGSLSNPLTITLGPSVGGLHI